jgi:hypothetical protein
MGEQFCVTKQVPVGQDKTQKIVKHWQNCIETGGYYMEM